MSNATIIVQCTVFRSANAFNTPWVLNKPRRITNSNGVKTHHQSSGRFATQRSLIPGGGGGNSSWWTLSGGGQQQQQQQPSSEPSSNLLEQYILTVSKDLDSYELPYELEDACGIPAEQLRLCLAEEIHYRHNNLDDDESTNELYDGLANTLVQRHSNITRLFGDEGPCGNFKSNPVRIMAFESTIRPRQSVLPPPSMMDVTEQEIEVEYDSSNHDDPQQQQDDQERNLVRSRSKIRDLRRKERQMRRQELENLTAVYGNGSECRVYDTDALPIAKAISRSLWPRSEQQLRVGLRLDAMDHNGNWYPGTVVEISSRFTTNLDHASTNSMSRRQRPKRIRVHFDNFSSKWDELYTIEQFFTREYGRRVVTPLYSQVTPRMRPTEFVVHHRYINRRTRQSNLFGQSFLVQCHAEWSCCRAAAQIMIQAARFLDLPKEHAATSTSSLPAALGGRGGEMMMRMMMGTNDDQTSVRARRLYERTQTVLSDCIDKLVDFDREYVQCALGLVAGDNNTLSDTSNDTNDEEQRKFRNPDFDATSLTIALTDRLNSLMRRLPFELIVCTRDSLVQGRNEQKQQVNFPMSLERTIGNYMNGNLVVVLQWREPPSESNTPRGGRGGDGQPPPRIMHLDAPVMYVAPQMVTVDGKSYATADQGHPFRRGSSDSGSSVSSSGNPQMGGSQLRAYRYIR